MAVKSDVRYVTSKRDKSKKVKKTTYKCEGSYVDIDGKSHRYHKRGFSTSEEAKEWERTFLLKAKAEVDSDITFNDLYNIYMDNKKNSIKRTSYYEIDKLYKRSIYPYFGDIKLNRITISKINDFQQELISYKKTDGNLYTNRTLEKIQSRFKTILKFGYTLGYISDFRITVFKNIQRAEELKKEMLFWQPEEYEKFISVVNDDVYIAFFSALYWCGLRNGEALALTWNDIDWNKKTIHVGKSYTKRLRTLSTPKTSNSYRTVIMPDKCYKAIKQLHDHDKKYIGFDESKLIFHFNKPLDDNCIRINKDRWIQQAGIKRIRIHDFRHSHVSLLISLGFNPFDIAKRLGHTVEMVNEVYGHWFDNAQKKMVDALNDI